MTVVLAQPATAHPVGLIASARTTLDQEEGWERGLAYAPEACGGYRVLSDCTAQTIEHGADERPEPVAYQPFTIKVEETCSTRGGYDPAAIDARLRRQVLAINGYAIGRELMLGELTRAEQAAGAYDAPNPYLADASRTTVLTTGPVKAKVGQGLLEEALGHALHGQVGYLHVPLVAASVLASVRPDGAMRRTLRDNQVVLEAGYPNVAPTAALDADDEPQEPAAAAAGTAWLYGTGLVVVRRGQPFQDAPEDAQTIDHRRNLSTRSMSQRAAAHYDPCAQFAVQITLED